MKNKTLTYDNLPPHTKAAIDKIKIFYKENEKEALFIYQNYFKDDDRRWQDNQGIGYLSPNIAVGFVEPGNYEIPIIDWLTLLIKFNFLTEEAKAELIAYIYGEG